MSSRPNANTLECGLPCGPKSRVSAPRVVSALNAWSWDRLPLRPSPYASARRLERRDAQKPTASSEAGHRGRPGKQRPGPASAVLSDRSLCRGRACGGRGQIRRARRRNLGLHRLWYGQRLMFGDYLSSEAKGDFQPRVACLRKDYPPTINRPVALGKLDQQWQAAHMEEAPERCRIARRPHSAPRG